MNSDNARLALGFEEQALKLGVRLTLAVDFERVPHLLLVAPSGSGKTYLLVLLLKQLAAKDAILILADFKGVDFVALEGCKHYYRHAEVANALERVFQELQSRMQAPKEQYQPLYFCIDEWGGFLSLYSKKEQDTFKQQLASLLMLGRGVGIFVILALQRADAAYITGRDNIGNCVGLGRLSKESARMTFPDDTGSIEPKARGHGYLRIDGQPLQELVVPRIRDYAGAMEQIHRKLSE